MLRGFTICVAKDRHFIFYLREEAQYIMKNNHSYASIRNLLPKTFAVVKSISTFAVRQLYLHNSYVDFLYPYDILFNNILEKLHSCLYSPHSSKEVVADLGCTSPFFVNK